MNESMRKIVYYENILEFKENTKSELLISELNNWQLCRTCLMETTADDVDLDKVCVMDGEGSFLSIKEMLIKATGLEITNDTDLPLRICKDCLGKISNLYYFTIQVHKAEQILKKLVYKLKGEGRRIDTSSPTAAGQVTPQQQKAVNLTTKEELCQSHFNTEYVINDIPIQEDEEHTIVQTITGKHDDDDSREGSVECLEDEFENTEEPEENVIEISKEEECTVMENLNEEENSLDMKNIPEQQVENSMDMKNIPEHEEEEEIFLAENTIENIINVKHDQEKLEFNEDEELQEIYLDNKFLHNSLNAKHNKETSENNKDLDNGDEDNVFIITAEQLEDNSNTSDSHSVQILEMEYQTVTSTKIGFRHRQHRVNKPLLGDIKCAICSKIFCRQRDLVKHVRELHPNSKAFKCRDCGMHFSHMQSLSRHMNTHKDLLVKNVCEFCSKSFVRVDDLKRHLRVHTGERPYSCSVCAKTFKQHGEMRTHYATHYPELKSFACDQCEKIFTSRNGLYLHRKTHSTNFDNSEMFQKAFKRTLIKKNEE